MDTDTRNCIGWMKSFICSVIVKVYECHIKKKKKRERNFHTVKKGCMFSQHEKINKI